MQPKEYLLNLREHHLQSGSSKGKSSDELSDIVVVK